MFRVKLTAKKLEGIHDGAIQITTDYEVRTFIYGDSGQWSPSEKFSPFLVFIETEN